MGERFIDSKENGDGMVCGCMGSEMFVLENHYGGFSVDGGFWGRGV